MRLFPIRCPRPTGFAVALLACLTAGCGAAAPVTSVAPTSGRSPSTPASVAVAPADPLRLVGMWRIEAPGEEAGAVLRLGDDLMIWRRCGPDLGGWAANKAGMFVGAIEASTSPCPFTVESTKGPSWLVATTSYAIEGTSRRLLDSSGRTTAILRPSAAVAGSKHVIGFLAKPPKLTKDLAARIDALSPIVGGTQASGIHADLAGRWIPLDPNGKPTTSASYVTFDRTGWWSGSDGCNGQSGRWAQGQSNTFLALQGGQTLIGCNGINVGGILARTTAVTSQGAILVMSDRSGQPIGKFVRF